MTKIAFFAAEPSADRLVAEVARELIKKIPDAELYGVGGDTLAVLGLKSIFDIRDFSTIGATELITNLPLLIRRLWQTIRTLRRLDADIFISVDMSICSYIVARGLGKKVGFKVHYIAPSVWLSRPWRAKSFARCYDAILTLFPFEPPYFQKIKRARAQTIYVGHPIFDDQQPRGNGFKFRRKHLYNKKEPIIGLFFGSRGKEVRKFAPLLLDSARMLCGELRSKNLPEPRFITTSLPRLLPLLKPLLRENNPPVQIVLDPDEKDDAICACDVAIAACGTIGAELAIRHIPHSLFYRVSSITFLLSRIIYNFSYFGLVNILHGRLIVPEFIQKNARASLIAKQTSALLANDGVELTAELSKLFPYNQEVDTTTVPPTPKPSARAAEAIWKIYNNLPPDK